MEALLVIGTRPQIIKTAPFIKETRSYTGFDLDIIHTGQHYDYEMSKGFFNELSLPDPILNLNVGSGSHGVQTGKMLIELEKTYEKIKPDVVIVPGDTNSTLAGALAASKMDIPVAHIESGARSFDMSMPEEVNRRLTDHCSNTLFTVSEWCEEQLIREGISKEDIFLVGDTMYESVINHMKDIEMDDILERIEIDEPFYVFTLHRKENTDDDERLTKIFRTVLKLDHRIIFPCHPRTQIRLKKTGLMEEVQESHRLQILEPLGYYSMLKLIKEAELVLTDSGGIQKEALWLGTTCITLRDNTEWRETIVPGINTLVGAEPDKIFKVVEISRMLEKKEIKNPYDYGGASKKIINTLLERYE